jgi:hypothetical protein
MIVHNFNILCVAHHPAKADAPLVVDSYTHLACSLSFQRFEAISRRVTQVLDRRSGIQLAQLAERPHLYFARELAARLALPDTFGFPATERPYHWISSSTKIDT